MHVQHKRSIIFLLSSSSLVHIFIPLVACSVVPHSLSRCHWDKHPCLLFHIRSSSSIPLHAISRKFRDIYTSISGHREFLLLPWIMVAWRPVLVTYTQNLNSIAKTNKKSWGWEPIWGSEQVNPKIRL